MEEMPLGEYQSPYVASLNDTYRIETLAYDRNSEPIPGADIISASFIVQKPDEALTKVEAVGEIDEQGLITALFNETDVAGTFVWVCQVTLQTGEQRSVKGTFQVEDPFSTEPKPDRERVAERVWAKLEDCFDSEMGGPWLRDMTLRYFDVRKIPELIDEALFDINMAPPQTHVTVKDFTTLTVIEVSPGVTENLEDPDQSLLVQGTLLAAIRHLMRSYVEQSEPRGAQVVFEDRRDYLERWGQIYQIELERYNRWLALWKRQFLNLGSMKTLVDSKAGRLIPAPMRTRYVGRGYR